MNSLEISGPRRIEFLMDLVALVYSVAMLVALLPSVHLMPLIQIVYYLVVPGYTLLRLVDHNFGRIDRIALMLAIGLGLLVGFTALFQTFYPMGRFNQSLVIPLIATVASAVSLRPRQVRGINV
jgi:hypothetical protein